MDFTKEVEESLKYYVYVYIDPRDKKPFYIGKGTGDRYRSHLDDLSDTNPKKVKKIAEIRESGHPQPQIDILRYGLSDSEARLVEAAAIDLIGKENLTNIMSGIHHSFGRITSQELEIMINPKPGDVHHKAILITINQLYRSDMTDQELLEATRGIWKIGPRRERAEYAMAVYQGIVREVYRINKWYPAGTLEYQTRDDVLDPDRWEFDGKVAEKEIRDEYIGIFVGKSGQNPIRYVNV